MTNSSATESTQIRKTVSFSKKRDKDLIELETLQDDFSFNAKELMRDGLRYRALLERQKSLVYDTIPLQIPISHLNEVSESKEDKKEKQHHLTVIEHNPVKIDETSKPNLDAFLNSETEEAEISEEDRKRVEKNLDF